ncbi:MAG TPA: hypothetical protein VHX39_33010, partial [Acetobacteraceae bacterium]|nr:hypothetical protein [Acetobacteraceae bacterium]
RCLDNVPIARPDKIQSTTGRQVFDGRCFCPNLTLPLHRASSQEYILGSANYRIGRQAKNLMA